MTGGDAVVLDHAGHAVHALHRGQGARHRDLEGVDIHPRADVEHQLLGEGGAQAEGAADQPRHHLGPVRQLRVQRLGVRLLEIENLRPGLLVILHQMEASEDHHDVVQRICVLWADVDPALQK